ncbi:MAG: diphthamide synthesis protein [Candidatus Pacearchaeota archaeon]|nr:diphthamide synthesis protein [Candidatus Pacearchaeota archaeon]
MKQYTLKNLEENYDLELDKVISKIKKEKAKLVLLQFPDGLKQYATSVVDYLKKETNSEFLIWLGSCYGACDTPTGLENIKPKIDLLIQFGHNELMPTF